MISVELRDRKDLVVTTVQVEAAKIEGVRHVTYKQKHYKYFATWANQQRVVFREVDKPLKLG